MTKCPHCEASLNLADFFSKESLETDRMLFKGDELYDRHSNRLSRIWSCPKCKILLQITESQGTRRPRGKPLSWKDIKHRQNM